MMFSEFEAIWLAEMHTYFLVVIFVPMLLSYSFPAFNIHFDQELSYYFLTQWPSYFHLRFFQISSGNFPQNIYSIMTALTEYYCYNTILSVTAYSSWENCWKTFLIYEYMTNTKFI